MISETAKCHYFGVQCAGVVKKVVGFTQPTIPSLWLSLYRVRHVVVDLGWVDTYFGCSTTCPTLPGQLEVWQNGLWSWAGWWNIENKVNPTKVGAGWQCRYPTFCPLFVPCPEFVHFLSSPCPYYNFAFFNDPFIIIFLKGDIKFSDTYNYKNYNRNIYDS